MILLSFSGAVYHSCTMKPTIARTKVAHHILSKEIRPKTEQDNYKVILSQCGKNDLVAM